MREEKKLGFSFLLRPNLTSGLREMNPKAAPWLWLSLSAAIVVSVVLLLFGSGSILNFLRKLTVHYAIEWGICTVAFGALLVQTIWEKFGTSASQPAHSSKVCCLYCIDFTQVSRCSLKGASFLLKVVPLY